MDKEEWALGILEEFTLCLESENGLSNITFPFPAAMFTTEEPLQENQSPTKEPSVDRTQPPASTKSKSKKMKKGRWNHEEDCELLKLVKQHTFRGVSAWRQIGECCSTRTRKQCKERWALHLDPTIKNTPWSTEEEQLLLQLEQGNCGKWSAIARSIPGRTEHQVKNKWLALSGRRPSRKKSFS